MVIKVSVIMAVYNTDREILKLAIDSVLKQSIKELELIICDDGSTDSAYSLLKKISDSDKRVIVLKNKINMGPSFARNRCLAIAKGEYIAIADADDFSDEKRLEKQVAFLQSNPQYSFVGTAGQYFSHMCSNKGMYWFCEHPQKKDFLFTLPFVHASIMFRKEALLAVNGYREDRKVTRSEDYDLLMRLYSKGYSGANIKQVLYYIRLDEKTFKRRKYRYRFNEFIVKYRGFRDLGLLPGGFIYVIKPLLVGLIPVGLLNIIKEKYYKN